MPELVIAVRKAESISSCGLPGAGVKTDVMGSLPTAYMGRVGNAAFKLARAKSTRVCVTAASAAAVPLKDENQVVGLEVSTRLATNRSVSGVTLTVPALRATE